MIRPLICGSVPAALSSKGSEEEKEEGEDESDRERAREAWREDKMVSGDPYAIDRTFGHAVDFVVDAGVLEVREDCSRFGAAVYPSPAHPSRGMLYFPSQLHGYSPPARYSFTLALFDDSIP